ncbi:MAG: T9SS type A sorting domain-containing protein [Bacteroidetes bacterium]|nr:MAG: T9SS type A sorting domain-containing protein [Bacteroidota bacterium]
MKQFISYIILIFTLAWLSVSAQLFEYRKLDINSLIQNQSVSVQVNSNFDLGKLSNIFDRDTLSLARTPGVNPLVITLSFTDSIEIVKSKILSSVGNGIWLIESAMTPEDLQQQRRTYKVLLNDSSLTDNQWDSLEFEKRYVKIIRLTLTKTTEGNFVRLNEWELYEYVSLAYLKLEPPAITMKPAWQYKIWKVWRASEIDTILIENSLVKWTSSDSSVAFVDSTGTVFGVSKGKATINAEYDKYKGKCSVNVEQGLRSTDPGDIIVTHISRLPSIDFVWGSLNPARDGWPLVGDSVTWVAHVLNLSKHYRKNVQYEWQITYLSSYQVLGGTIDLPPFSTVNIDYKTAWNFDSNQLEFKINPNYSIPEAEEDNNSISFYTYALSAGFYVEESLNNYFREYQHLLNQHRNCWEDWANSILQIVNFKFNTPFIDTSSSLMYEQYRIDKIVIVPDGSLPLDGVNSVTSPNFSDKSVDLIRGFPDSLILANIYGNHFSPYYTNPFYFDQAFVNDLLQARYLVDPKGFSVSDNSFGDVVNIKESGNYIGGTNFLPWESGKLVHKFQNSGLLYGDNVGVSFDEYSWNALSLIAGHRATLGNYNPPGNSGEYLNDLPENNIVTLMDSSGNPLSGANVRVFRSSGKLGVMFGKYYDSIPDMEFTSDEFGKVNLGRCPFDEFGAIFYGMGNANVVILIRVQQGDKAGYRFLDITEFNRHYWSGQIDTANYELKYNLYPVITSVNDNKNSSYDILQIRYNSMNSSATAVIHLEQPSQINLSIYTSLGRLVGEINESISIPGISELSLDRFNLSKGIYLCRLKTGAANQIKKICVY